MLSYRANAGFGEALERRLRLAALERLLPTHAGGRRGCAVMAGLTRFQHRLDRFCFTESAYITGHKLLLYGELYYGFMPNIIFRAS